MKKLIPLTIAVLLLFSVSACSKTEGPAVIIIDPKDSAVMEDTIEVSPVQQEPESSPVIVPEVASGGVFELTGKSIVTQAGKYEISEMNCELITSTALYAFRSYNPTGDDEDEPASYYYYLDSTEDGAEVFSWSPAEDMFTSVLLNLNITNLSGKSVTWLGHFSSELVYETEDGETRLDGVCFQSNPRQTDADGFTNTRSLKALPVKSGETCTLSVITDVPLEFHDAATSQSSPAAMWLYVYMEDDVTLAVNLRENMTLFNGEV